MVAAVWAVLLGLVAIAGAGFAYPAFRRDDAATAQERFRSQRLAMTQRRGEFTKAAAALFPTAQRLEDTDYISPSQWRLDSPVPLDSVAVTFVEQPKAPRVDGRSRAALRIIPRNPHGDRKGSYSEFISGDEALKPGLWWDAPSYDLLELRYGNGRVDVTCSASRYFAMVDVCEAVGHEFVASRLRAKWRGRGLRLRTEIGDAFDLTARPFTPAVPVLVLFTPDRGDPTFLLHGRDSSAVASAGGTKHVFGGQFQPSSRHSMDPGSEASLWNSIARELAEELLGMSDVDGSAAAPVALADEPLAGLEEMRLEGSIKVWLLGMGLDPLTLWPDILTVAVVDESAFRARFPNLPSSNSEGTIIGSAMNGGSVRGFPFREHEIDRLCRASDMHPAATSCIRLAWRHRAVILDRSPT